MSPFVFIPIAFFGICATFTVLLVFCAREYRSRAPACDVGAEAEAFLAGKTVPAHHDAV